MHSMRAVAAGCLAVLLATAGCGGGGGGGSGTRTSVSGVAARGAAIAGATVTLADAAGATRTATSGAGGAFSFDTTGLTPPFLVQVTDGNGTLYSVSADASTASTVNVTPLTDLVVRSWYQVQNVSPAAGFADPVGNPPPGPAGVSVVGGIVSRAVQLWTDRAGVSAGFNLISTPFTADGTGIDQVLDGLSLDAGSGQLGFDDGTTAQQTQLSYSSGDGSITVTTVTAGDLGDSSSAESTVVPVASAAQTALDQITAVFDDFAATVNANGASVTGLQLLALMDPDPLYGGTTASDWADRAAYALGGKTLAFSGIAIRALDTAANTADVVARMSQTQDGQTSVQPQEFHFRKVAGSWLLSGDGRLAELEIRANMVRNQGSTVNPPSLVVEVHVQAPQGAVAGVTVQGPPGGLWQEATALGGPESNSAPWGQGLTYDSFETYTVDAQGSVTGGDLFTFVVRPTGGGDSQSYDVPLNAVTTEPIEITSALGGTLGDAHVGTPLAVEWTLPATFPIAQVRVGSVARSQDPGTLETFKCDDMGEAVVVGPSATSAQVTIPATCGGQDTAAAEIYVQVFGTNGELSTVYYQFGPYSDE